MRKVVALTLVTAFFWATRICFSRADAAEVHQKLSVSDPSAVISSVLALADRGVFKADYLTIERQLLKHVGEGEVREVNGQDGVNAWIDTASRGLAWSFFGAPEGEHKTRFQVYVQLAPRKALPDLIGELARVRPDCSGAKLKPGGEPLAAVSGGAGPPDPFMAAPAIWSCSTFSGNDLVWVLLRQSSPDAVDTVIVTNSYRP